MAITVQEMAAQLQRAGYPGPFDPASVQAAYMRTATPADLVANGLIAAPGPAPSTTSSSSPQQGFNNAAAQNAVTLANNAAQMAYNNAKLQQVDIPGQRLAQDQLAFDRAKEAWSETFQQAQANIKNPLDIAGVTGVYNGQPTLAAQGQQNDTALRYLTLLSGLRGPNDPFQYLRTLAGTPAGLTDIVNTAAGRYQLGAAPSGEQSAQASIGGQIGNLNAVQAAQGGGGNFGGAGGGAGAPANMAQAAAMASVPSGSQFAPANASTYVPGQYDVPGRWSIAPGQSAPTGDRGVTYGLSNLGPAHQEIGAGPGQGATVIGGQRGVQITGYDPTTNQFQFNWGQLGAKPRIVFGLQQTQNGQNIGGIGNVVGATDPTGGAGPKLGDWNSYSYLSGQGGANTYQLDRPVDPNMTYSFNYALPGEGGAGLEPIQFTGSQLLGLSKQQTAGGSGWDAPAPGGYTVRNGTIWNAAGGNTGVPAVAGEGTSAPTIGALARGPAAVSGAVSPAAAGTDPLAQVSNVLSGLPLPNQINAQNFNAMDPSQKGALWGAYEFGGPTGAMRPEDAQFAFQNSLPKYQGPAGGSVNLKV